MFGILRHLFLIFEGKTQMLQEHFSENHVAVWIEAGTLSIVKPTSCVYPLAVFAVTSPPANLGKFC